MPKKAEQTSNAVDRARLDTLIDKLVSVQLDLKPLCRNDGASLQPRQAAATIAAACAMLQSGIEDLREVIHALGDLEETRPASLPPDGSS